MKFFHQTPIYLIDWLFWGAHFVPPPQRPGNQSDRCEGLPFCYAHMQVPCVDLNQTCTAHEVVVMVVSSAYGYRSMVGTHLIKWYPPQNCRGDRWKITMFNRKYIYTSSNVWFFPVFMLLLLRGCLKICFGHQDAKR